MSRLLVVLFSAIMFLIVYVLFGSCRPLLSPSKKCLSQSPQAFHISSSLLFGPVRPIESGADVAVNVERVGHSQQHNALCVDGLCVVFLLEVSLVLLHSRAQALSHAPSAILSQCVCLHRSQLQGGNQTCQLQ